MKAIRFKNQSILEVELPKPTLKPGEALVRVLTAGICATDITIFHGYADFKGVPGHEFVGIVEKCPDRPDLVGQRVVADINAGCGRCSPDERHCPNRRVLGIRIQDGAFAEYCAVPASNLYPVPDGIKTRHAAFVEILAAALEISQQIHIKNQNRVGVVGDGCLGLLTAIGLRRYCRNVMLLGRHQEKLSIAKRQGVETFLTYPENAPAEIASQLGLFDIMVDATGTAHGLNWCIPLTRPEGTVVVKTTISERSMIDLATVVVNELAVQGSRCGDMAFAMDFLDNGRIDVEPLIEAVYPFARFREAFSHAMTKGSLKVLLAF